MTYDLDRFIKAQETSYDQALSEIRSGRKRSHCFGEVLDKLYDGKRDNRTRGMV